MGDVWHYQDANTDLIRRTIAMFDWDKAFVNTNVNEEVHSKQDYSEYTF